MLNDYLWGECSVTTCGATEDCTDLVVDGEGIDELEVGEHAQTGAQRAVVVEKAVVKRPVVQRQLVSR